nr:histone H3.v1-like [Nicotiana tomentosiformis]
MPKANQTPSKAKSSTKAKAKPKIMKPKSKKSAKPSREPIPIPTPTYSPSISSTITTSSSHVPVAPIIPTSIVPSPLKPTTHSLELTAKNTSMSTTVKATPRNSVKKVLDAVTQVHTIDKESVVQGESVPVITDQVQHPLSKLDVLVFVIDTAPLDNLPPMGEKPQVEKFTIEKGAGDVGKEVDTTIVELVVDGEGCEQVNDSTEEENHSEEDDNSKSEGEDQENVSESEGSDEESEEEDGNMRKESQETRAQEPLSLLTPFTGDKEVSSDEDDVPLSEVGRKPRKTLVKVIKTPITRSKRKVVDSQLIKESRSAKKPKKKVSIVEPIVYVDGEDEYDSTLPAKSSSPKRKGAKVTKPTTPSTRASRGKTRNNVLAAVDRLIEFRNQKLLNGKILAITDEKVMAQLVKKLELQGWKHIFVKAFPPVCVPAVVELYANFNFDGKVVKSKVGGFEMEFDAE